MPRLMALRPVPRLRVAALTLLAMLAFAANSLLCRAALRQGSIDAASFTSIRLLSGAVALGCLAWMRGGGGWIGGNWRSALALFAYAAGFSLAYRGLSAATGALLLFGAVQVAMMAHGLWRGERLQPAQLAGWALAIAGLVLLLMPGLAAPSPRAGALMLGAGVAWGVYSIRGRTAVDPLGATAGNFARAAPLGIALLVATSRDAHVDALGALCAVASGALASGLGYAIWYAVLPALRSTTAATVQLCVPLLAALGGAALLSEPLTLRLAVASAALLGGIALVGWRRPTAE